MLQRKLGRALAALLACSGCDAPVGTHGAVNVPSDSAQICENHCASIGLGLSAVAIMANNVGCVCQPKAPDGGTKPADSTPEDAEKQANNALTAGMATLMLQEEARRQQEERAQQQRMQQARRAR
jgi:hypothetical protein